MLRIRSAPAKYRSSWLTTSKAVERYVAALSATPVTTEAPPAQAAKPAASSRAKRAERANKRLQALGA